MANASQVADSGKPSGLPLSVEKNGKIDHSAAVAAVKAQDRTVANGYTGEYISLRDVKDGICPCGCGRTLNPGRTFRQGCDATRRGMLIRAWSAGNLEAAFELREIRQWYSDGQLYTLRKSRKPSTNAAAAEALLG